MLIAMSPWQIPLEIPVCTAEVLDLWRFRSDLPLALVEDIQSLLSRDEQERAGRLRDSLKAARFITARACLRQILGQYLQTPPRQLSFVYGPDGKPDLASPDTAWRFNLSHSGPWGVVAVMLGGRVGVDIEALDAYLDYEKIAARYFSDEERARLQCNSATRRRRRFYRLWTRKEACLKGQGGGFSALSSSPEAGWYLRGFTVGRGCLGTVAVDKQITLLRRWHHTVAPSVPEGDQ